MLREIVLDTETTGLNPKAGDRLVEIGCVELIDRAPTGAEFHYFINPVTREVHPEAEAIHGISTAFLADKPHFAEVVTDFLAFIGDSQLVIHNAAFDIGFINMELERDGRPALTNPVVDTLALAKRKHPAGPNTLDGLCKRYGVDNTVRVKHGAIVDSLLLAEVYIELLGIRQADLGLAADGRRSGNGGLAAASRSRPRPVPLPERLGTAEHAAHAEFVMTLGKDAIWLRYQARTEAAE